MVLSLMVVLGALGSASTASASRIGNEGCSPGFWKGHTALWEEYTTGQRLDSVFTIPSALSAVAGDSLLTALSYGGGNTTLDKAKILLHHAVAAILNAASEQLGYPYRRFDDPGMIIPSVNTALASGNTDSMLQLKDMLDDANNLGADLCD